jgi:hypothetical protein
MGQMQLRISLCIWLVAFSIASLLGQERPANEKDAAALLAAEPAEKDVQWGATNEEGLTVGVRTSPADGKLKQDQPLELQFLIKNNSDTERTISCTHPIASYHFELREENQLWIDGHTHTDTGFTEIKLAPGEIYDSPRYRTKINTTGLIGEYFIPIITGFYVEAPKQRGTVRNLGGIPNLSFSVGAGAKVDHGSPDAERRIVWGKPMMGLRLGAQLVQEDEKIGFVEKSGRFHFRDSLQLQLHVFNASDRESVVEIDPPKVGESWEVNVLDDQAHRTGLKQHRSGYASGEKILLKIAPGEETMLTETRVDTVLRGSDNEKDRFKTQKYRNAGINIADREDKSTYVSTPILTADLSNYTISATIGIRHVGSDFTARLSSGLVPFRVVPNPLDRKAEIEGKAK